MFSSDINECELSLDDCDENAECQDLIGDFECTCNHGYSGNGTDCSKCYIECVAFKEEQKL